MIAAKLSQIVRRDARILNCSQHARFAAAPARRCLLPAHCSSCLSRRWTHEPQGSSGACDDAAELAVLPSPVAPWKGAPLRVVFAAEKPLEGELSLIAPDGSVAAKSRERHGGPPYFWFAEVASPAAGTWHATLARDRAPAECGTITRDIAVRADAAAAAAARRRAASGRCATPGIARRKTCFPPGSRSCSTRRSTPTPSWPALHEVLRDRSRNVLFNHLGLGEDEMKLVIRPDCADLPYFLRAYFAFKMGLPFGYSKCSRGGGGKAPKCPQWLNIQNPSSRPLRRPSSRAAAPRRTRRRILRAVRRSRRPRRRAPSRPRRSGSGSRRRSAHYLRDRRRRRPFRIRAHGARTTTTPITIPCR